MTEGSLQTNVALVELVNRVVDRGVVVSGEVVISVAEIELLYLNVNVLLSSFENLLPRPEPGPGSEEAPPRRPGP